MHDWTEFNEKAGWYGMFCCGCLLYGFGALFLVGLGILAGAFVWGY